MPHHVMFWEPLLIVGGAMGVFVQNQIVPEIRYVCQYVPCMMNTTASFKTKAQLHNCVTLILAHTTECRPGPFASAIFYPFDRRVSESGNGGATH